MPVAGAMLIVLTMLTVAAASEDCTVGWYWNGVKCQPLQVYTPREREYWTRNFPEKVTRIARRTAAVRPDLKLKTSFASRTSAAKSS